MSICSIFCAHCLDPRKLPFLSDLTLNLPHISDRQSCRICFLRQLNSWYCNLQEEAESGCEIDYSTGARAGPDCAKLDSFESFVRSLLGVSPMSSFAHLLYTLRKSEQHEEEPATEGGLPLLLT